jgi:hypothetical protein
MVETEIKGLKRMNPRMNKRFKVEYDYEYKGKKISRFSALKKGLIVDRIIIDRFRAMDIAIKIPSKRRKK